MKIKIQLEVEGQNNIIEVEKYSQNFKIGESDYFKVPISKLQMFKSDNDVRVSIKVLNEEEVVED